MKKRMMLSISLCLITSAVATAADLPAGKTSVAAPQSGNSATKEAAPNTYTVEDLYKKSAELKDKKVVFHGRAVKVTSGIMGKTWTHVQDGTGDKTKGTSDIICISDKKGADVGEVVTVTGTLKYNVDNPRYKVMIEDATFKK